MVDSVSRSVDPAKDVVVDLSVGVSDDFVGAHCPLLACIVELEHHLVGECTHFVRKRGNFLLDGFEQDELAKTAKEACNCQREYEKSRDCGGICNTPAHERLAAG